MQPFIEKRREQIAELCRRYHVRRLAVFGSAARDDFDPARSAVDVMVEFEPEADDDFLGNFYGFREGLEALFGRKVDLIREGVIRNPYRLRSIKAHRVNLCSVSCARICRMSPRRRGDLPVHRRFQLRTVRTG